MRRIFSATFSQGRAEASLQEHRDLVDAIAAGDEERAATLGQEHVETAQGWREDRQSVPSAAAVLGEKVGATALRYSATVPQAPRAVRPGACRS